MKNIERSRLRSSLCGIAACSVFAVSVFAVPLATVKSAEAEGDAYWCEGSYARNGNVCASSASIVEYDYGCYENYGTIEEQPYQAEVMHSSVAINFDLSDFISSYNSVVDEDSKLNASGIEYSAAVKLIDYNSADSDSEDYASYFDFNGDNGYIVINSSNEILDLKISGDCDYLRSENELYFSMSNGFMRVDDNGLYSSYKEERPLDILCSVSSENAVNQADEEKTYIGQDAPGDGKIDPTLLDEYVRERYPDYVCTRSDFVVGYNQYALQSDTSYYLLDCIGVYEAYHQRWTEGNCALNSMYNVLDSWRDNDLLTLPIPTDYVDLSLAITSDPLYVEYVKSDPINTKEKVAGFDDGIWIKKQWYPNYDYRLKKMPLLYTQIRNYAVYNHGYKPVGGYSVDYFIDTIKYVANKVNDNKIDIIKTVKDANARDEISKDKAVLMVLQGSSTYHNHAVALNGYYEYTKRTEYYPGYRVMQRIYFYQIADGHYNETRKAQIFDPNTSSNPTITFFILGRC